MNKPRKIPQKEQLEWMKSAGYSIADMDNFWKENYGTNSVVTNLTNHGYTWRDMNLCVIQKLPTQKQRDLEIKQKLEAENKAAEEAAKKEKELKEYYENHFEELMIQKIDSGENLTEAELERLVWNYEIEKSYGDDHRWTKDVFSIIQLAGRYFEIDWQKGLTEMQDNEFYKQPYEVTQIEIEKVVPKEWLPIPIEGGDAQRSQLSMFDELKAWADKWGVKYDLSDPTEKWPYQSITFNCCDYQEPTFHYNPTNSSNFWQGGE